MILRTKNQEKKVIIIYTSLRDLAMDYFSSPCYKSLYQLSSTKSRRMKLNPSLPVPTSQSFIRKQFALVMIWIAFYEANISIMCCEREEITHVRWEHPDNSTEVGVRIQSPGVPSVDFDSVVERRPNSLAPCHYIWVPGCVPRKGFHPRNTHHVGHGTPCGGRSSCDACFLAHSLAGCCPSHCMRHTDIPIRPAVRDRDQTSSTAWITSRTVRLLAGRWPGTIQLRPRIR